MKINNIIILLLANMIFSSCAVSIKRTITPFSKKRMEQCHLIQQDGLEYPIVTDIKFDYSYKSIELTNGYWCHCGYSKPSSVPDPLWEDMKIRCIPMEGIFYSKEN